MINKESHGLAFKAAIEKSSITKSELARLCGVSPQSVYNWELRGVPSKHALKVGKALQVAPDTISSIDDSTGAAAMSALTESATLAPCYYESGEKAYVFIVDEIKVGPGADVAAVIIEGCAMAPTIRRGDRVYFDRSRCPSPGDIAVAMDPNGRIIVRKYREVDTDGGFQLIPESDDWPTITSDGNGGYKLLGAAIGLFKSFSGPM